MAAITGIGIRQSLTIAACAALVGCVNARVVPSGAVAQGPPVSQQQIRLFVDASSVPRDRVVLGSVTVRSDMRLDDYDLITEIRKKAAELGANAILVYPTRHETDQTVIPVSMGKSFIPMFYRDDVTVKLALAIYSPDVVPERSYDENRDAVVRFGSPCFTEPARISDYYETLKPGARVRVVQTEKTWAWVDAGNRGCYVEVGRLIAP